MTRTPDEIKKGLRCLSHDRTHTLPCSDCEYHGQGLPPCRTAVHEDAIALIQQLQAEKAEQADTIEYLKAEIEEYEKSADKCCYESKCNAELNKLEALCERLMDEKEQLEAERDAAVNDLENVCKLLSLCNACKSRFEGDERCRGCFCSSHWGWRGVQKED